MRTCALCIENVLLDGAYSQCLGEFCVTDRIIKLRAVETVSFMFCLFTPPESTF